MRKLSWLAEDSLRWVVKLWSAEIHSFGWNSAFSAKVGPFLGPNRAFLAQMKSLGSLYYSSQKPWFYSLNITTFCDTCYFKYEHMFGFIKNLIDYFE
jgi:hypothetical protein